jgi:cell division protein FtsN
MAPPPATAPPVRAPETRIAVPPPSPALARERSPAPVRERSPASARERSPRWVVQVGVFRSEANANVALAKLRRLDADAAIERRKGLHFVVSRPFGSQTDATVLERRLEAAGMSTLVRERHEP